MTTVFESVSAWRDERGRQLRRGETLGFVPTMGALHAGHRSLIRRSVADNDRTLVSIFVNATQFNDAADLAAYPRPLDEDLAVLGEEQVEFAFLPLAADLYPERYRYRVHETDQSLIMEGEHRPGHFDGVLTVVLKLLQIASADRAYFGEKDWQQLRLIDGMVRAFFLSTAIVPCPTVREPDGLALSSRNQQLSRPDRERAPLFYRSLRTARSAESAADALRSAGFAVDYVEDRDGRRLGAVRVGSVRLIDNVSLEDLA